MFTDIRRVRALLEDFLKDVYGTQGSPENAITQSVHQNQSLELLLAKRQQHIHERPNNAPNSNQGPVWIDRHNGEVQKGSDVEDRSSAAYEPPRPVHNGDKQPAFENSSNASAKPHRNMYEFDEDDPSTWEPHSPPEKSFAAEADDVELRKASVTNPWTIAKVNAQVSSTAQPHSGANFDNSNEQLMTPCLDFNATGIVSKIHRESFVPGANLPSPARSDSSYSPPVYQNPGPRFRSRASFQHGEEDAIEFTQESTGEGSTYGHSKSSELQAKQKAHNVRIPGFQRASEIFDMDPLFEPHSDQEREIAEDARTEMHATQLTVPVTRPAQSVQTRNAPGKPSLPPFRTPVRPLATHPPLKSTPVISPRSEHQSSTEQSWRLSQQKKGSTSPLSHAHPPPLSQHHRHPMASPPALQPSPPKLSESFRQANHMPHPDLDEIMDFEHRKKVVNAQRKTQSELTNRYLNPGQLAEIQRESTVTLRAPERSFSSSCPFRRQPAQSLDIRDQREDSYNSAKSVCSSVPGTHAPSGPEPVGNSFHKQSPHRNRYQAARAALTRPTAPSPSLHAFPAAEHEPDRETTDSAETPPRLPEEDPRAYLIKDRDASRSHANGHAPNTTSEPLRPGLKIRRVKTSKLPLETIFPDSATHNLSSKPLTPFPTPAHLTALLNALGTVDAYPGTGMNRFVAWDANSADVGVWQSTVVALVRDKYVARLGGNGEEGPANLQMSLGVALRAHAEGSA